MPVLTNADRMVLISAMRGEPIHCGFAELIPALRAMGYVSACYVCTETTWDVRLSAVGERLARAYVDTRFGELWTELGVRLAVRAEFMRDVRRRELLLERSKVAMRRGMDAAVRAYAVIGAAHG